MNFKLVGQAGWGMYICLSGDSNPIGVWEIKNGKITLKSTQYGRNTSLFPEHLEGKSYKDTKSAMMDLQDG